ncbi:hypothetical protein G210_4235 [Candida maltosa Xu316]|uniref:Zn(2)-C6 fungal-type domain-containing protein n=1 Tax=Candida maltosa (strain Xu316) TaxID=1245528 RepID=M3J175_CANMX|nr:hypothetical protein G210_4235 [Candida maltosa Xu316]
MESQQQSVRKRSKSGCLTCRRRKKKCDESKPVCKDCSRLHRECVWPSDKDQNHEISSSIAIDTKETRKNKSNKISKPNSTLLTRSRTSKKSNKENTVANVIAIENTTLEPEFIEDTTKVELEEFHEPDTNLYSSDESNNYTSTQLSRNSSATTTTNNTINTTTTTATSTTTTTTANSVTGTTSNKKPSYYLTRIAMQQDCVEDEIPPGRRGPPRPPTILFDYVNVKPQFEYEDDE